MEVSIRPDDNRWVYTPGHDIQGKICITTSETVTLQSLKLRFLGVFLESKYRKSPETHLTSDDDDQSFFLDKTLDLIFSWKVLDAGIWEYPFSFSLPKPLPSSFDLMKFSDKDFSMAYKMVVLVKKPQLDTLSLYENAFTVVESRLEDWNERRNDNEATIALDGNLGSRRKLILMCCPNCPKHEGQFGLDILLIGTQGSNTFYKGQSLNFQIHYFNKTNTPMVQSPSVELVLKFETRRRKYEKVIYAWKDDLKPLEPAEERVQQISEFEIYSDLPATSDPHYRAVFKISYVLHLVFQHEGLKLSKQLPIQIRNPSTQPYYGFELHQGII